MYVDLLHHIIERNGCNGNNFFFVLIRRDLRYGEFFVFIIIKEMIYARQILVSKYLFT